MTEHWCGLSFQYIPDEDSYDEVMENMDIMLTLIEFHGMLPPPTFGQIGYGASQIKHDTIFFQWDPEAEDKQDA
jgi:hypothetical protein